MAEYKLVAPKTTPPRMISIRVERRSFPNISISSSVGSQGKLVSHLKRAVPSRRELAQTKEPSKKTIARRTHRSAAAAPRPEGDSSSFTVPLAYRSVRLLVHDQERSHYPPWMMTWVGGGRASKGCILIALVLGTCVGCTNDDPSASPESARTTTPPTEASTPSNSITIDSLGLSFDLPPNFEEFKDPKLLFLARSADPPSVLSIAPDTPDIVDHEPQGGEILTSTRIDGVEAVIVEGAELEGLPPSVAARELLVANGNRSFTLIFSASETELPALWEGFIESVEID